MTIPFSVVDAFTDRPFAGNPAAVCRLRRAAGAAWMQDVAREMNLSETAFLVARADGGWDLRWFTPATEVDLCGHATLASAHALWETGSLDAAATARFHTASGELTARRRGDAIELDFPAEPPLPAAASGELLAALGVEPRWVGRNRLDYLIELDSEASVRAAAPDLAALGRIEARGVMITALAEAADLDFVSRYFAPRAGVPEDPVTGSAHCCLAPYWAERLGSTVLSAYQASRRGGRLEVEVVGERVLLRGRAVTVSRGELLAPPA